MKRNTLIITALAVLLLACPVQGSEIEDEPRGYLDLEWIPIPDSAAEVKDIDLSAMLLSIAADADETGDPHLAEALKMVRSIRVKSYSLDDGTVAAARDAVEKIGKTLERKDWKRLIYIKDDQESTTVSTKRQDGDLVGLMVVFFSPGEEVAFVNVVGDLDLGTLFKLAQEFDTDDLEDLLEEMDGKHGIKVNGAEID